MNNQEIFNHVKHHLLVVQKVKAEATNQNGMKKCVYRSPDGRKCAIGCLIPDNMYKPDFEEVGSINSVLWIRGNNNIEFIPEHHEDYTVEFFKVLDSLGVHKRAWRLLDALQEVHDCSEIEEWPEEIARVAKHFRLKDIPVEELAHA